jgi:peptide/nickel transport system substrate-binding protein
LYCFEHFIRGGQVPPFYLRQTPANGERNALSRTRIYKNIFVFILVLVATACATRPTPPPPSSTRAPEPTRVIEPTRAGEPTATPETKPIEPPFIFGAPGEPVCLDPALAVDPNSARVTNQIFQGLVKFERDTLNIAPALAEKWSVADGGKTWTFTLRRGVKFHDGTDFDADAVVKNWDYRRNSRNPTHIAQIQAGRAFEYYESQFGGFDGASNITQVEAVDTTTVKFTLREPQGAFLNNLAMPAFGLWSPRALERTGSASCVKPVGAGAYQLREWKPGEAISLDAFENYWDQANAPKMKRVIIRAIPDDAARRAALLAGEIHGLEGIDLREVPALKNDARVKIILRPAISTGYVAFNFRVKEFQDARVRQTFASALNKASIVEKIYGDPGFAAKQFLPPAFAGFIKDLDDWKFDSAAAKKLLSDAGFPNGIAEITFDNRKVPLELGYSPQARPYAPYPQELATMLANDWAKAGINARVQTLDAKTFLERRRNGQLPLYLLGWVGDNGDPDEFLCYTFCLDARDAALAREGFLADKEISDTLKRAATLTDQAERARLYQYAERLIRARALRIFIAHAQTPLAFAANVEGYLAHPLGIEFFESVIVK